MKKYLITTPIFYPNSVPHIGAAHTMILADVLTRIFKLFGHEVYLLTGTDEHGNKIANTAKKLGISVEDFLEINVAKFKELASKLNINYNRFIRTTDEDHIKRVQDFWLKIQEFIYKGKYSGFYSQVDETFYSEEELIDGKAPTGSSVEYIEHECYFLKSSFFENQLRSFLNTNITFPINRVNELKGFISNGLKDLCISRGGDVWGIPVPNDPSQSIYVWFDALINYLSGDYENSEVIHVVGKDIAIFHGVHWPTMLFAGNIKMFNRLLVHNWWLVDSEKISKSLGNTIDPLEIIENFGINQLRFMCIKEPLLSSDSNFDVEKMKENYNSFLVNKFSNLIYRLWSFLYKKNRLSGNIIYNNNFVQKLEKIIDTLDINFYIETLFEWCNTLNETIEREKIWTNVDRAEVIFAEVLGLAKYFTPIVPEIENLFHNIQNEPYILFNRI